MHVRVYVCMYVRMYVCTYLVMFKLPTLFHYTTVMSLYKIVCKLSTAVSVSWQFCLRNVISVYSGGKIRIWGGREIT